MSEIHTSEFILFPGFPRRLDHTTWWKIQLILRFPMVLLRTFYAIFHILFMYILIIPIFVIYKPHLDIDTGYYNFNRWIQKFFFHRLSVIAKGLSRASGMNIKVEGQINDEASMYVSNHVSFSDIYVLSGIFPFTYIAKEALMHVPVCGVISKASNTLFVDRDNSESKDFVAEALKKRAINKDYKMMCFPEGTTTAGTHLNQFSRGAFNALLPVQVCALEYKWKRFNPSFDVTNFLYTWIGVCSNFKNDVVVHFGPLLKPFENETSEEYARRAQIACSELLGGIPTTDYSSKDKRVYRNYLNNKMSWEDLIEYCHERPWFDQSMLEEYENKEEFIKNQKKIQRIL
eukprot:TRINITY_DN1621_c0_g1_i1.p1 TRINITY_DN1621_c0_g1~~TRINITY_DN1621_c0_g1_i1.p1  ORF type:complete len:354 (+),score=65.63 TRINITY_DN1621_c0_g1_i1:30-1064(+)